MTENKLDGIMMMILLFPVILITLLKKYHNFKLWATTYQGKDEHAKIMTLLSVIYIKQRKEIGEKKFWHLLHFPLK